MIYLWQFLDGLTVDLKLISIEMNFRKLIILSLSIELNFILALSKATDFIHSRVMLL